MSVQDRPGSSSVRSATQKARGSVDRQQAAAPSAQRSVFADAGIERERTAGAIGERFICCKLSGVSFREEFRCPGQ